MRPTDKQSLIAGARARTKDLAAIAPLLAAIIAPLSILFDIPALTERWYLKGSIEQPDPTASLVLSGVGLGANVIANVLLVVRFSTADEWWRVATRASIVWWTTKVIVAFLNLILFGVLTRNAPDFSYTEGFWCAVVSLILSSLVLSLLMLHFFVEFRARRKSPSSSTGARDINKAVRIAGRHFMLQTTGFISLIAMTALIFSKIENWSYLQGIYFGVAAFLTVGFGDFVPTKTSTRILLFPLALTGIATLAALVQMIISWFTERMESRRKRRREEDEKRWRDLIEGIAEWDKEWQGQLGHDHDHNKRTTLIARVRSIRRGKIGNKVKDRVLPPSVAVGIDRVASRLVNEHFHGNVEETVGERDGRKGKDRDESSTDHLQREIAHLEVMHAMYDTTDYLHTLVMSLGGFVVFWVVGAAIFSRLEGWTYGNGLYFCYIFFLTLGYGDFAPVSPAGRVVFVVYSLVAVPIMASFAVQTVTQVFTKLSTWQLDRRRAADGIRNTASALTTDHGLSKSARPDLDNSHSHTTPASKGAQVREKARKTVGSERMKGDAEGWERGQRAGMWRNLWRCGGGREGKVMGEKSVQRGEREIEEAGAQQGEDSGARVGGDIEEIRDRGERGVREEMLEREKVISHSAFVMQHHSRLEEQQRVRHQPMTRSRSISVSARPFNDRDPSTPSRPTIPLPPVIPVSDSTDPSASTSSVADSQSDLDGPGSSNYTADPNGTLTLAQSDTNVLTSLLLQHACELELHARRLLIHYLPDGSKAEVVLKADRNVQVRDVKAVREARKRAREMARDRSTEGGEEESGREMSEEQQCEDEEVEILAGLEPKSKTRANESRPSTIRIRAPDAGGSNNEDRRHSREVLTSLPAEHAKRATEQDEAFERAWDELTRPMTDEETMEEVRKYRESFAAVLAVGSRLRNVEGLERLLIERRR